MESELVRVLLVEDDEAAAEATKAALACAAAVRFETERATSVEEVLLELPEAPLATRALEAAVANIRRSIDAVGQWPKMLAAGRQWIEDHFDATAQGARLARIYERVAGGPLRLAFPTHDAMEWRSAA